MSLIENMEDGEEVETFSVFIVTEIRIKKVNVGLNTPVKTLFNILVEKLNLKTKDIFSIAEQVTDEEGVLMDRFLDFESTLREEGISSNSFLVFKIKYLKTIQNFDDPVAESLYFEQIQQCVIKEIYPCPERTAVLLASLELQAIFGDYDPLKHKVGYLNKIGLNVYLPSTVSRHDYAYWQERLFYMHSKHKGLTKREAQAMYLDIAREIPFYGMTFFEVMDEKDVEYLAGVAEDGVFVFNASSMKLVYSLTFDVLLSWKRTESGIDIRYRASQALIELSFSLSPLKQKEMLDLIDEYFFMYPGSEAMKDVEPNNPNPKILADKGIFSPIKKRVFLARVGSRLEYLKAYYRETCAVQSKGVSREFCQSIDQAIDDNSNYQCVMLSSMKLEEGMPEIIVKSLIKSLEFKPDKSYPWEENIDIQVIDTSGIKIQNSFFPILFSLIEKSKGLRELNLSRSHLENKGSILLSKMLESKTNLQRLTLNNCNIGNKGTIALIQNICKKNAQFYHLVMKDNRITDRTITSFLAKFLEVDTQMKYIDFESNQIEVKGIEVLLNSLKSNKSLETFVLSENPFTLRLAHRIAHLIAKDGRIQIK